MATTIMDTLQRRTMATLAAISPHLRLPLMLRTISRQMGSSKLNKRRLQRNNNIVVLNTRPTAQNLNNTMTNDIINKVTKRRLLALRKAARRRRPITLLERTAPLSRLARRLTTTLTLWTLKHLSTIHSSRHCHPRRPQQTAPLTALLPRLETASQLMRKLLSPMLAKHSTMLPPGSFLYITLFVSTV